MTFDTSKAKAPGRQSEGFQNDTSKRRNFSKGLKKQTCVLHMLTS